VLVLQSAYGTDDVVFLLLAMLCAGGKSGEIIPHKLFAMAGTGYISAMVCSIEALKYVNFPTKELGKSCKVTGCCTLHKALPYLAAAMHASSLLAL
jgi:hypothetical protein